MASEKYFPRPKYQNIPQLKCDLCSSTNIIETKEGYVCHDCGGVLEIQRFVYHRPYFSDVVQYAKLGTTQIGNVRERLAHAHSVKLNQLNKLQCIASNEKALNRQAKIEISRIFNCLNLPCSLKELICRKFKKIRSAIRPGTKYRTPDRLVPLTIYFVFKFRNISINEAELLEVSKISKKDFNAFKLQIQKFMPHYKERDRKQYITQKILEVSESFELGMDFFYLSKELLYKLWNVIKNTKDDVIAGLVTSVAALCTCKEQVTVSSICTKLGIKMSTIQSQVKKRIFEQFKINGFTTLVKSSELLKQVIKKMNLISVEQESQNVAGTVVPDIVEIKLGDAIYAVNHFDDPSFYFFALGQGDDSTLLFLLKIYGHDSFGIPQNNIHIHRGKIVLFELELLKYVMGKGPPMTCYLNSCF